MVVCGFGSKWNVLPRLVWIPMRTWLVIVDLRWDFCLVVPGCTTERLLVEKPDFRGVPPGRAEDQWSVLAPNFPLRRHLETFREANVGS